MALKATGVNGVVMAEPAAGLLSNEDCLQYSSLFVKEIIEKVQDDHFAVVLHNCGNTELNLCLIELFQCSIKCIYINRRRMWRNITTT